MQKGQISFDFIIAMGFLILFLQSFVAFSDGFIKDYDKINTSVQAEAIIKGIGQTILIGNTVAGAKNASITYDVPVITAPSGKNIKNCRITINSGGGLASYSITIEGADEDQTIVKNGIAIPKPNPAFGLSNTTPDCKNGETITFTK